MRGSERNKTERVLMWAAGLAALFAALVLFCVAAAYSLRPNPENTRVRTENFYAEPEGTLDVVFVGSSAAYAFFSPLRLYETTGLTSAVYATPNLSVAAVRWVIEECRKTQPDAEYVVELRAVLSDEEARANIASDARRLTDVMPLSALRDEAVSALVPEEDRFSARFDLVKYHVRWKELGWADLRLTWGKADPLKGWIFSDTVEPLTAYETHAGVNARLSLDAQSEQELKELLAWCQSSGVKARFVMTPFARSRRQAKTANAIGDIVASYGFAWGDLGRSQEAMGLDPLTDFSDPRHVNQAGAVKCTDWYGKRLLEELAPNGRADAAAWDACLAAYRPKEAEVLAAVAEKAKEGTD